MTDLDPLRIAQILADSPVWARLALTAPDRSLVERAADKLAAIIVAPLAEAGPSTHDHRHMSLPIL